MEVNSLTLVEVMCYAQDDSFGIPVVSSSTQCFTSYLTPFYNFRNLNK